MISIDDNAFVNASIEYFVYCGHQIVNGSFLSNALSCNFVETSVLYPSSNIGGVNINRFNNVYTDKKPEKGLTTAQKTLISISMSVIFIGMIAFFGYAVYIRKRHRKIENRIIEEFG